MASPLPHLAGERIAFAFAGSQLTGKQKGRVNDPPLHVSLRYAKNQSNNLEETTAQRITIERPMTKRIVSLLAVSGGFASAAKIVRENTPSARTIAPTANLMPPRWKQVRPTNPESCRMPDGEPDGRAAA